MKSFRFFTLFSRIAFVVLLSISLFSCGDTPSSKFLKQYESFVVSAEKSAQNKSIGKLDSLAKKEADFMKQAGSITKSGEWTAAEAAKFTALSARWTAAEAKLTALKTKEEAGKATQKTGEALKDLGSKLKK